KIIDSHLHSGSFKPGEINGIKIDHILMQDATGTMVIMQFEMIGIPRIKAEFAIVYIDHNMIQIDYRNREDHLFLQSAAAKYGIHYSRSGNGICHQVNTERFARPGKTLLGSDSHTPTAGSVGCLAIGAGGIDVSIALAGHPFELETQKIVRVNLTGELMPWVSAKDIILEMLRRFSVKGGLGIIYEFGGPSVKKLTVTQRATICNMITELGATSGIFPSDEQTRRFLKSQKREHHWTELKADNDATYDDEITLELNHIEPLIAMPHSPDNVVPVQQIAGQECWQVCLGSSVNSWYEDLAIPAEIVSTGGVHPRVDMTVSPGSRQILDTITRSGVLMKLIHAGARILEPACGPCVGMGQAPPEMKVSLRTFNRNFPGRSGTINDSVYLCSPAVAGASALKGVITDPRSLGDPPVIIEPEHVIDDSMILLPPSAEEAEHIEIVRGRNIKPPPPQIPLSDSLSGKVLIVLGDNISTGSMAPDGVVVMADRSNIAALAEYTFMKEDKDFVSRAKQWGGGFIAAGNNYGQGSSREHAVLSPKHLGIKAVFAFSFARIHRRNLIDHGIIPLIINPEIYNVLKIGTSIVFPSIKTELQSSEDSITLKIDERIFKPKSNLNNREKAILIAGGLLKYMSH
ncbi:MAG: aconitate hydratase, partial [Candidatus Fischerbacteria bacterium RBG_13_37_8]